MSFLVLWFLESSISQVPEKDGWTGRVSQGIPSVSPSRLKVGSSSILQSKATAIS